MVPAPRRGDSGQAAGAPPGPSGPGAPGHPPRAARGGCGGAWPRQVWAYCARNSRVRAYAAVFRAVSSHAAGWPHKTHNFPAHLTSPVSGRSAHGGRSYVFCSALAATGFALGEYELWRSSVCFRRMPIIASLKRLQI
jgi:hypothetical protein